MEYKQKLANVLNWVLNSIDWTGCDLDAFLNEWGITKEDLTELFKL